MGLPFQKFLKRKINKVIHNTVHARIHIRTSVFTKHTLPESHNSCGILDHLCNIYHSYSSD